MTDEDFNNIMTEMGCKDNSRRLSDMHMYISLWRAHESWHTNMLKDACDADPKMVKKFNRVCLDNQLLKKRASNLNKTPKMVEFIKRLDESKKYSMVTEDIYIPQIDMKFIT